MKRLLLLAAPVGLFLVLQPLGCSSGGGSSPAPAPQAAPVPPTTGPTSGPVTFDALNAVLARDCSGGACHSGDGSNAPQYVGNESVVDVNKGEIALRIGNGTMPPGGNLSAADRQTILTYCNQ